MNKNYIAEFMKENDIKVGEEFEIEGIDGTYHFDSDYILCSSLEFKVPNKFHCILSGVRKIEKSPKQEYVEVDNSVPRFTEIEVRDFSGTEWERAYFIFKSEDELYSYYATNCDNGNLNCFRQARMLKPTEPEFKEGESC